MKFVINIHHIGTLENAAFFKQQFSTLFGDQTNPFDPKYSGNKIPLVVKGELATSLQALAASGNSFFADLGLGGALHGSHKAFSRFQNEAIDIVLNNSDLDSSQKQAALWDLHRYSAEIAKSGGAPSTDGSSAFIPLADNKNYLSLSEHTDKFMESWNEYRGSEADIFSEARVAERSSYQNSFSVYETDIGHVSNTSDDWTPNTEERHQFAKTLVDTVQSMDGLDPITEARYARYAEQLNSPTFDPRLGSGKVSEAITSALNDLTKHAGLRDASGLISPDSPDFGVPSTNLLDSTSILDTFKQYATDLHANESGSVPRNVAVPDIGKLYSFLKQAYGDINFTLKDFDKTGMLAGLGGVGVGDFVEFADTSFYSFVKGMETGEWGDFQANVAQFGVELVIGGVMVAMTVAAATAVSPLLGALVGATWAAVGIYQALMAAGSLFDKITDYTFGDGDPFAELIGEGGPFEGLFGSMDSVSELEPLVSYLANILPAIGPAKQLAQLFEFAAGLIDPLVVDLDGDGVNTTSVSQSTAYFDLDNNGVAERAGWIEPEDGFVVHDWNGDSTINNRSEQFASFDELSRHDTNGDGVVSVADSAQTKRLDLDGDGLLENVTLGYDSLKIWIDANSDGKTDEGELKTLGELGISSIDLNKTDIQQTNNGNELNAKSTVTFDDGSVVDIYGVSFDRVTTDTDFSARIAALDLSPEHLASRADAFVLPQLGGSGNVPPLLIATLESDDVLNTLRAASNFDVGSTEEFMLRVQQLIIDWAGVGDVAPGASAVGNLRHLAAMEAFTAQSFSMTTGGPRGHALDAGWDAFVAGVGLRLALQTESDFNPGGLISYDPRTESISGDFIGLLDHLGTMMFDDARTSSFDNQGLTGMVQALWQTASDDLTGAETAAFDAFFKEAFTLYPQAASTRFFENSKYYDPEYNLSLDPDYEPLKAVASVSTLPGGDRIIHLADVDTDFHDYEGGDSEDKLYDLTLHDAGALMGEYTEFNDNASDDGREYYGAGDDYYAGGYGSDRYYLTGGVGYDTIFEYNITDLNKDDTDLLLVGSSRDDTTLSREGDDLFISWGYSDGVILVKGQFKNTHAIEGIVFGATANEDLTNFTPYDADWIKANAWYRGGDGRDALTGTDDDETFYGAKGDDYIDVGRGHDTIVYKSGDGNDILKGDNALTTLKLENLDPSDLSLFIREETLYIEDTKTGHVIAVEGQFSGRGLAAITFDNGQSWDSAEIESRAIVDGTEFADDLQGSDRSETFWGREGDDTLRGGKSGDTFLFASGDGNDFIVEGVLDAGNDVLKFTDLILADIYLTRGNVSDGTEYDLFITVKPTGEVITIPGQFNGITSGGVETIEFADGYSLDESGIIANLVLIGTDQSEILRGSSSGQQISGGLGDDAIYGGYEGDTFVYRAGDGNDIIHESAGYSGSDVLKFTDLMLEDVYLSTGNYVDGTQDDLFVTIKATGEIISIPDQFHPLANGGVEYIEFADKLLLDSEGIIENLKIAGTNQDETLRGGNFAEKIDGGLGDDVIHGGNGGDTYIYSAGDGNDTINESTVGSGTDVLKLMDLSLSDVEFKLGKLSGRQDYDLFITVKPTGEVITVTDGAAHGTAANGLEQIEFANGLTIDVTGVSNIATYGAVEAGYYITGVAADDNLLGTSANETLSGNGGNDFLQGNHGSDTYVFARGGGVDVIRDNGSANTDALRIRGYSPDEVVLAQIAGSYDLVLSFAYTTDQVTLVNSLNGSIADQIEKVVFDDNTVWTMADARQTLLAQATTDGSDIIEGYSSGDVIEGGLGNDTLLGAEGSDTYIYRRGDGHDTITEDAFKGSSDKLLLADINLEGVRLRLDGNDVTVVIFESNPGAGDGGSIRLINSHSDYFDRGVEKIEFADGTIWDRTTLRDVLANQANSSPVLANAIADQVTDEDAAWSYTIPSGAFDDPDRDLLTYTATLSDGSALPSWLKLDELTGTFSGILPQNFNGVLSLKIVVFDGTYSAEDHFDLIINPVNDAPIVVSSIAAQAVAESETWNFTVPTNAFTDVDGDVLVFSATQADGTDLPEWLNFDAETRTFTGKPLQGALTALSLKVIAFDGMASAESVFDLSIEEAPTLSVDIAGTGLDDTLSGTASDESLAGLEGNDVLNGGDGNDTYIYRFGDGNDVITETYGNGSGDRLELGAGILASGVTLSRPDNGDDEDITLHFIDGGSVMLDEQFYDDYSRTQAGVEEVEFADGTVWNHATLRQLYVDGVSTGGNDTIDGFNGSEQITADLGDDTVNGHGGNDTYVYRLGDGDDIITETYGNGSGDRLELGAGILASELTLSRPDNGDDDDITLHFIDGGSVTLDEQFYDDYGRTQAGVEEVEFADGTVWNHATLRQLYVDGVSTDGNDTIAAFNGSEKITAGLGNDVINGHGGNDTYVYRLGDGDDIITETYGNGSGDRLELGAGILASELTLSRPDNGDDDDITLNFIDGGSVTLDEQFYDDYGRTQAGVEQIAFADGTVWSSEDLKSIYLAGTDDNDVIVGYQISDSIYGESGNDTIQGGAGDDTIDGGAGNDLLTGGAGDDTFIFANLVTGHDIIFDFSAGSGSADSIEFSTSIFADYAAVLAAASDDGFDTMIEIDGDTSITLQNVLVSQLHQDDFQFV